MTSAQPLAGAPYVVLFDLKPLNKDGNWQVGMYCMYARKGTSEAPRTHIRACKISEFLGACPQTPLTQYGPHFLYLPWPPTILSVALPAIKQVINYQLINPSLDYDLVQCKCQSETKMLHIHVIFFLSTM